jgi:hypothetical protein
MSERVQLSVVSWKSACEEKIRRLLLNDRHPGTQSVEGWQLCRARQGRLRRYGVMVELTVDKSSIAAYSPDNNDVNAGS